MNGLMKTLMMAVMVVCSCQMFAGKRDGMATIIMKDGSKLENVQIEVPKYCNDKKFTVINGKKQTIKSADVKRILVWNTSNPENVAVMVYTKCRFYTKKGIDFYDDPYWLILSNSGPNVSHWVKGNIEFTKDEGYNIMYSSLEYGNFFWKKTDEYPIEIEFDGTYRKKTREQLCVYLADDPALVEALNVDKGKNFKIDPKKFYISFSQKRDVTTVNLWDYAKIVKTYSPKK